MLTECFNPACRRRLDYLRDGRVIRTVHPAGSPLSLEHYWLCGSCYGKFDFEFKPNGAVTLCPKRPAVSSTPGPVIDYLAG
jgi:hypothetical protein